MPLYVLDTDHLTLCLHGDPIVAVRVDELPSEQLATTIVSVEEQLTGWYTRIRQARKNEEKLKRAYEGLSEIVESIKDIQVLPFTGPAIRRWMDLRKALPRLGKLDLAIAAIVLESGGVLVTRNRSDFEQVPELQFEDWSKP